MVQTRSEAPASELGSKGALSGELAPGAPLTDEAVVAHVRQIADQGYTIVENAVDLDLIDAINEDLLRLEVDLGIVPADNLFEGSRTVRIYNLLVHGSLYEQIPVYPSILPICEGVLDRGLLVSSLSSIAIGPEETPQPIHADDQIIPLPKPHPPTVCNTMWALTDFTEANGATRIIPGTHLANESPDLVSAYDSIPAELERGSVLVWHGSLWHGGGANTTDARRVGIAMNYCAGYIRQQENQQLGVPVDTARRFPHRLQELIGYGIYNGLIGHIDKTLPAARLLADDGQSSMIWDSATPPSS
jgi:ectoine hydroxylase-related dioxygenase (phytanoyl-CoA dioxygenase family)